jgi:hypothetical protein
MAALSLSGPLWVRSLAEDMGRAAMGGRRIPESLLILVSRPMSTSATAMPPASAGWSSVARWSASAPTTSSTATNLAASPGRDPLPRIPASGTK